MITSADNRLLSMAKRLDKEVVLETLTLQIAEVDMLESMYPEDGAMVFDDPFVKTDIEKFIEGNMNYDYLSSRMGFILSLTIEEIKVELVCQFPHEYPNVIPQVCFRCPSLHSSQLRTVSDNLQKFLRERPTGELYLYAIIDWIKDNIQIYIKENKAVITKEQNSLDPNREVSFTRMWIYSHHIYSKIKRKDILDYSHELKLSGFSLPGKPGIIVIEGYSEDVEEFWYRIRSMNWKRLVMKDKTTETCKSCEVDEYRRFKGFQEMAFDPKQGRGREYHMDLGQLLTFLKEHGFEDKFELYFGVQGTL